MGKKIDRKKVKNAFGVIAASLGLIYAVLSLVAKKKKPSSIYADQPKEKNPNAGVSGEVKKTVYKDVIKPMLDKILSFCGLVILSPLFLLISLAIYIDNPGPVFFTQKRVGKNKEYFMCHKFRSMKMSTPHDTPTHLLENPEQYITRVGKFLRKYSLDELPQIWDIFIGNMSILGPRPALWNQEDLIHERDKYGANDIKPGLTGWAQINGRDELEIEEKAKLDGEYVEKESFLFDAKCFLGTIISVLKHEGVVEGGTGEAFEEKKSDNGMEKNNKKKILVVCQYYYPEPFRIADICEEMVRRGHEVQVVTGYPNYPEGNLYDGYGKGKHIDEVINGVKVHRCYTIPRETSSLKRLMNYYSYAVSSMAYVRSGKCVASDGKPFDVVFCNQLSPVMMADAAIVYKKKYKVPAVMYCLDLWPESLIAGGIARDTVIYKYFYRESKRIYRQMDHILVTSRMFTEYLTVNFGIEKETIAYLPQYAEGIFEKLGYKTDDGIFDFMFAGNIGAVQNVETILKAAKQLEDMPVKFHIVGGGTDLDRLERIKAEESLDNVIFYGRRPLEEMPEFYGKADAMLVTLQADPVLSLTLPGKVQSYMAVGKPIIGAIDGEARAVIEDAECGFCGKAEDENELIENIRKFIREDTDRKCMGDHARTYYEKHFNEKMFMDKLEEELTAR